MEHRYESAGPCRDGGAGRGHTQPRRGLNAGRSWGRGRGGGRKQSGHHDGVVAKENVANHRQKENVPSSKNGSHPQNKEKYATVATLHEQATAADSVKVKDLAKQMQIINNAIGDTLVECVETSESLVGLQSQVQDAMKRVEKMNLKLSTLQNHASFVQQSLETIPSQENGVSSIVNTSPAAVTPDSTPAQSHLSAKSRKQGEEEKRKQESNMRGGNPPRNDNQEKPSKSFRELMRERKNISHKPITSIAMGSTTKTNDSVQKVDTLNDLIMSCAPYLTGSPTEYTSWLREELDVNSIADLAEAVVECPEMLVAGNGSVGMWQKRKFCDAVHAAVSESKESTSKGTIQPANHDNFDEVKMSVKSSQGSERDGIAAEGEAGSEGNWACSVCTCVNPKPFLVCSACGSTGGMAAATGTHPLSNDPKRIVKKKEQDDKLKKQQEKVNQKKVVELARQEEAERAAAEADRRRHMVAKREKQADMALHESKIQQQQKSQMRKKTPTRAHSEPAITSVKPVKETMPSATVSSHQLLTLKKSKSTTPSIARKKKGIAVDLLSSYIKPSRKGPKNVSPIFDMIQNKSTVETGRRLMNLEAETQWCKEKLAELEGLKKRLTKGIAMEEQSIIKSRKTIVDQDKKIKTKWSIHKFEKMKEIIEDAQKSIENQKESLRNTSVLIPKKIKQLQQLRADIAKIKGGGIKEDASFHIDGMRDDRGFSMLMVAAQNDDFFTAKTCFDLGADAYATSPEGLTAIDYSYFFGFEHVTNLIVQNGGILPQKQSGAWSSLQSMAPQSAESKCWDDTLKVAETAALPGKCGCLQISSLRFTSSSLIGFHSPQHLPAETLISTPEACEVDKDKRMPILTSKECLNMDFTCFESRLVDSDINTDLIQRVVLLDQSVYNWCLTSADQVTRSSFVQLLEGLKPVKARRSGVPDTRIRRRAIIGAATTYELLSAEFEENSEGKKTALFTPFVAGEVEGVTSIGVLVWAVVPDSEASLHKTLIANTEFMRHKVNLNDRFLAHKDGVLELGKDMHLLDLHSTSIWTTSTMNMYVLNLDDGDLDRVNDPAFAAKKRIVHSEEQVNKAIFRTSHEEAKDEEGILASGRLDMSCLLNGGAGTGKTLLMIKKVSQEDASRKVLVVSRLPRLVNIIKTAVEERRGDGADNQSFTTYEDLLQLLARRVVPVEDSQYKAFVQFDRVRFDCDGSNVSFSRHFIDGYLNTKEKKQMATNLIESLTLWHAIIVIKSQAKCATTKLPLTIDDFVALPPSFGLTEVQRQLCHDLFIKYEQWRESEHYWDEMDRVLYILKCGPSVFRDDRFIPWTDRVNRFGEMDLLNDEGEPLYPFFYDIVCADEAQDFTELDLVLFAKMSASLFLSADPAQSVEVGVKMREGTVNDVIHSLVKDGKQKVKDVIQYVSLQTNHRTHAQNLAISQAIRRILARSFKVPITNEAALINGKLPKALSVANVDALASSRLCLGLFVTGWDFNFKISFELKISFVCSTLLDLTINYGSPMPTK
ncbi:hypothetical protein ACHAXR_008739 [Thalassiosira sp. AJA248-18]